MFEEFVEGSTFMHLVDEHKKIWQEQGLLTEKLRLVMFNLPCQALFWLEYYGIAVLDIKPDNMILRNDGSLAIIDHDLGHAFPRRQEKGSHRHQTDNQEHPELLNRRCTSLYLARSEKQKGNLFPVGRKKQGIRCISKAEMQSFLIRAARSGLANLWAGAAGFKQARDVIEQHTARRNLIGSGTALRLFDRKWAFAADHVAVLKMLLMLLTLKPGQTIAAWDDQAQAACKVGAEGIRRMLVESLRSGVEVKQPQAFEKLVDFFAGALGPGERRDAKQSMLHIFNTTPVLPQDVELAIKLDGCFRLAGGCVSLPATAATMGLKPPPTRHLQECPIVALACQPGKGNGVIAEQDIDAGTALFHYGGDEVMNYEVGRPYISLVHPSRYVAVVQGVSALQQANKISVDAQMTLVRNWDWVKANHNVGPFVNAADNEDEINCMLDRHSLWKDSAGLWWMVMYSTKAIPKGTFLHWKYSPTAGAGGFWSF
jgi:hypothetical protein